MRKVVRGFYAVAHAVKLCRPNIICAYPITPQTEIVENLAEMYANGELENCKYITAESEFDAASILVGASATGARTFTATCSQGLILMSEVLFNAAGMRLPIVMVNTNRAISAPLSIWNDLQDSMVLRDAGIIQIYVEDNQEAHEMIPQAYKIAESVMFPTMVCMDGFKLTHAYEPIDLLDQELVDSFLPPYDPPIKLSVDNPLTFGSYAPPHCYMEFRYRMHKDMVNAKKTIEKVFKEWAEIRRDWGGLIEYKEGKTVLVAMGSLIGTIKEVAEENGLGYLKIRTYRPFPTEEIKEALKDCENVIVFDRAVSFGYEGILTIDIRNALYGESPDVYSFIVGLGGRDVPKKLIEKCVSKVVNKEIKPSYSFEGLKEFEEVLY
ncbi:2-ketoisovalerate ferredoxin oxidoreductase subunit alpha [Archaeoglobus profundus]|uniref:Pyruvate flavodoxin/ferredoxin oxidoreductase domain protein n=1 Tax=Archaeoglobus profundus (strain DSM 5631 / JCM 9629 / NBRC 100127 / Av18) TaxID=572546 RepID=D2RDC4_ARCPA|nr:2-ketoisovalerate ferredoxin oxidoreductase subunit alpha [Archaeoglobus profundus]ADB58118.1 pyruvate flavodoxin/ferredoxin oxidoreductase domain protein [Archaeoglobus profundus DSM 5631]